MEFLKMSELELNPAGYLVSKKTQKPVNNKSFVEEQRTAEYIVKLADAIKDKSFKATKVDDLEAIKREVRASINDNSKKYVKDGEKPTNKINDELVKFALDFASYEDDKIGNAKINILMNQFNSIDDVESVGDYFEESVVKLNGLYSIKDILAAVKINTDKLN